MTNPVSSLSSASFYDYTPEEHEAAACLARAEPEEPEAAEATLAPATEALWRCGEDILKTVLACAPVFVLAPETLGAALSLLGPCVAQSTNLGKCLGQSYEQARAEEMAAEASAACVAGGGVAVEQGDDIICRLSD